MKDVKNIKLAYIGGGSRGWAKTLMSDLAIEPEIAGSIYLYDINFEAAKTNAIIGNKLSAREDVVGKWNYFAVETLKEALTGADFVFISIVPGTFDEMESDVHTPEEYGIYQSVGDTTGPGGIVRALRTIPIYKEFALAIKEYCPDAWVINFTNPMTMCVRTLYKVFPEIKAIGCCHEVFNTQSLCAEILEEKFGIKGVKRHDVVMNVLGVNHFTWVNEVKYKDIDLMPYYKEFVLEHPEGRELKSVAGNWATRVFVTCEKVKFDLFNRFGIIAAAGDRHLAEFCPGDWYLESPEKVEEFKFALTPVSWRKEDLKTRLEAYQKMLDGEEFPVWKNGSGEESVKQMKALLGLGDFVTNINIPNEGQMLNTPIGAVVETNAYMSGDSVRPLFAGSLPTDVNALVQRIISIQEIVVDATLNGDYERVFNAFCNDPNVCISVDKARELYNKMLYNTKEYLPYYEDYAKTQKDLCK